MKYFIFFLLNLLFNSAILLFPLDFFDAAIYDSFLRFSLKEKVSSNVVLVTFDEFSDDFFQQQYPYPFAVYYSIFNKIIDLNPRMIAFSLDFPFFEKEDFHWKEKFNTLFSSFSPSKKRIIQGERINPWGEEKRVFHLNDFPHGPDIINFDHYVYAKDGVHRRILTRFRKKESFPFLVAKNFLPREEKFLPHDYYFEKAEAYFSLYRFPFSPNLAGQRSIERISLRDLYSGSLVSLDLKDKIILLAKEYETHGETFIATPFSKDVSKRSTRALVKAAQIEALINHQKYLVKRVPERGVRILGLLFSLWPSFAIMSSLPLNIVLLSPFLMTFLLFLSSYLLLLWGGIYLSALPFVLIFFVGFLIWAPLRNLREREEKLVYLHESNLLRELDEFKENFLSLIGHDLKTPLSKVSLSLDCLEQVLPAQKKTISYFQQLKSGVSELERLTGLLMDFAKVEKKSVILDLQSVDMNDVIKEAIKQREQEMKKKNISLTLLLDSLYPLLMDKKLIIRILINLLDNAIRYSPENSSVVIESYETKEEWVKVSIKDSGMGVEKEDSAFLFQKFYRGKNVQKKETMGQGLGLYLAHYFISLHQGKIFLESTSMQGSTFSFELPYNGENK